MLRRPVSMLFLLVMLILPQTSGALPREVCTSSNPADCVGFKETETGFATLQTLAVPSDGSFVFTTSLTQGLQYRLRVTGTWRYDSNASHLADMAYSTSNSWGSANKTAGARSLEIEGLKQSDTAVSYSSSHTYNVDRVAEANGSLRLRIVDNSYTDGNSGSLSVEVLRAQRVTYRGTAMVPFGVETVNIDHTVVLHTQTVTSPTPINIPIGPYDVPGVPTLVTVKGEPKGNGYCFTLHNSTTGNVPSDGVCLPNLLNVGGAFSIPLLPVQPFKLCDNKTCDVGVTETVIGQVAVGPYSIPDQVWDQFLSFAGERPFQPGSGIEFSVEWQADRDHLYLAASGPGGPNKNGIYQPFDSTSPSELNWFLSNRDRLSAKINIAILFPDGSLENNPDGTDKKDGQPDPFYILPGGLSVPGLGQFIEASFSSRVDGR